MIGSPVRRRAVSCAALDICSLLLGATALSACAQQAAPQATAEPSAQVVQRLLELRLARSRDVPAYRLFFREDSAIPTSLAQAAAHEASATKPPIPQWDAPYVSSTTTSAADIVVVWKKSDAFPGHAAATVFTVSRYKDRWVILNAREVGNESDIPKPVAPKP